ncbi:hypothetical protein HPB47_012425 [Ixodes persulcatus]|uniref:Uncharacterized protein n=1 Tax=Ixodes persulcatus TaxID=34615 RepID=A0AC60NTU6_IXOPE|nr:hypothetical protein HPB47_012425 [Ixodes persulcatus]
MSQITKTSAFGTVTYLSAASKRRGTDSDCHRWSSDFWYDFNKHRDERLHHAEVDDEAQTATVPTQLPQQKTESPHRHSSDQVEICIEAHQSNHDGRKAQRLSSAPSPAGLRSSRQKPRKPPRLQDETKPLKSSWLKMISGVMPFQGYFNRGEGTFPRRSLLRQRTTSTEMIITTDAAVQLEKPAMVDDSQQVSEAPVTEHVQKVCEIVEVFLKSRIILQRPFGSCTDQYNIGTFREPFQDIIRSFGARLRRSLSPDARP